MEVVDDGVEVYFLTEKEARKVNKLLDGKCSEINIKGTTYIRKFNDLLHQCDSCALDSPDHFCSAMVKGYSLWGWRCDGGQRSIVAVDDFLGE